MSAEAVGWTYRHSPFIGPAFAVHLAVADSVNDQHDNEFWMVQRNLARKARVSLRTVNSALGGMVEAGYLETDDDVAAARTERRGRRYRFLFPEVAAVYDTRSPAGGAQAHTQEVHKPIRTERQDPYARGAHRTQVLTNPSIEGDAHDASLDAAAASSDKGKSYVALDSVSGKTGTRLPELWEVSPAMRAWVRERYPTLDYQLESEKFDDYWQAVPGAGGRKLSWVGTWRNWMHKAARDAYLKDYRTPAQKRRSS